MATNALFADNTMDWKSFQDYLISLFGGPIVWKANKQDIVTISSTEAELLVFSQIVKEVIYISRLLQTMRLRLDKNLTIQYDNKQTIRLIDKDSVKLNTKLCHVDIHNHWLRQERSSGRIHTQWVPTAKMAADGLTKSLPVQKHQVFIRLMGMDDIMELLWQQKHLEELRDQVKAGRAQGETPRQEGGECRYCSPREG